ncbi:MAG: indole-3-glycerol phosphate synthase TrpC [Candidatus Nitrospinota bacterium M3_3B_026]
MRLSPVLRKILEHKREEVRLAKRMAPKDALTDAAGAAGRKRSLKAALSSGNAPARIIAEVKRATPSVMLKPSEFDPAAIARSYEKAGAVAVSVLTDARFFLGSPLYVPMVREAASIPVLRKDFIIDEWQIAESAALGADAVLLMAVVLDGQTLAAFHDYAARLGLEALVEIHSEEDWEKAAPLKPGIVGINNRDFLSDDLKVDLETTSRLTPALPEDVIVVSESGIESAGDIRRLARAGVGGFLVGSALMREEDPGAALTRLLSEV